MLLSCEKFWGVICKWFWKLSSYHVWKKKTETGNTTTKNRWICIVNYAMLSVRLCVQLHNQTALYFYKVLLHDKAGIRRWSGGVHTNNSMELPDETCTFSIFHHACLVHYSFLSKLQIGQPQFRRSWSSQRRRISHTLLFISWLQLIGDWENFPIC